MAVKRITCPKCSHEQRMGTECEACGVIFARYKKIQDRKEEAQVAQSVKGEKQRQRLRSLVQTLVLVALTAGATYYYLKPANPPAAPPHQAVTATMHEQPPEALKPANTATVLPPANASAMQASAEPAPHPVTIEEARQATVSIETPWGSGSGFFVSKDFIVTNRHVVQVDEARVADFRQKVEVTRNLVDLEKKKLSGWREQMRQMPQGPARRQLEIVIAESERNLNNILPELEKAEARLTRLETPLQPSDIKIILADNTSREANFMLISENRDLALLSVFVADAKYLQRPPEGSQINQGDKVFTIGSPVGLRNTVTAGVFSGYRKDPNDGSLYLQTDAPINPGNSGGPLIDENGYVHGVNTMIIKDTEGIGFAIPIETVFEEFASSLY